MTVEQINRARRARISPHDREAAKVLRTCSIERACVSFRAFAYRMDTVRATKGAQVEMQ
jgi:hypothetical protein